jgi:copper chaperone NosL
MKRLDGMAWLIAAGVLAGCRPVDTGRPPTVRYGEEACASCRMIIGDEHFAAALVTPTGEALKFDDIGCLVEHEADGLRPDVTYWVRDSKGREWLDAREATFVHSAGIASPMGFELAARPPGQAASEPAGRMLRFHELPGFLAERSREAGSDRPEAEAAGRRTESPPTTDGRGTGPPRTGGVR